MSGFRSGKLLRIFVDETDRHGLQPLYTAIVQRLRARAVAGATVFRGVEGFGCHDRVHAATVFAWLPNLPIVIEVVDDADKLEALLPELRAMIGEGLVTLEAAEYLKLTPAEHGRPSAP